MYLLEKWCIDVKGVLPGCKMGSIGALQGCIRDVKLCFRCVTGLLQHMSVTEV